MYVPDPKIQVPEKYFESAMNRNPDGWGIMALVDGFPIVQRGGIPNGKSQKGKKTTEDVKQFLDAYDFFRKVPHAIHFRTQSHGAVDEENCHPFEVGKGTYMMHNGTMYNFSPKVYKGKIKKESNSDTWHFANAISEMVEKKWLRNDSFIDLLNILAGDNNRLIFLDERGFFIPRRELWNEREGVLYSNLAGIEYISPSFRERDPAKNIMAHGQTSVGGTGTGAKRSDWSSKESRAEPKRSTITEVEDQNQGHLFLLNGDRLIRIFRPEEGGEKPPFCAIGDTKNKPESETGDDPHIMLTDRVPLSPQQQHDMLNKLSFSARLPKTIKGWKDLSITTIEDLIVEEPEMMADAIWELVNA